MALPAPEKILEQIRQEAKMHEDARQMSHDEIVDMAVKDERLSKRMSDYAERQQGIENQFAKISQHRQEDILASQSKTEEATKKTAAIFDDTIDPSKKLATDEVAEASTDGIKDAIKESAAKTFKENTGQWTKQFHHSLEERASFKQFQGALKTDLNLFQGKMQFLTQIPGVQFAIAGLKFVLARLALWFYKGKFGQKLLGPDSPIGKMLARWRGINEEFSEVVNELSGNVSPGPGHPDFKTKEQKMDEKNAKLKSSKAFDEWLDNFDEIDGELVPKPGFKTEQAADKGGEKLVNRMNKQSGETRQEIKDSGRIFMTSASNMAGTMTKQGTKMGAVTTAFRAAGLWLTTAISGLTVAAGATAASITAVITPMLATVAFFALLAVGIGLIAAVLVFAGIELYKWGAETIPAKWAEFKQWFWDGWDKIVEVGQMVGTWFSDKSTSIKLTIKHMIAVITDGIASIVNGMIEGMKEKFPRLAKYFNIDQYKMEGGAVDAVAKQRSDFEAMKQNRDMNTAGTAVLNAQGEAGTGGGGSTLNNMSNNNTVTNKQSFITESTKSNDSVANGVNSAPTF